MAKIGLIRFTQSDTERVVKTVRKTETLSSRDLSSRNPVPLKELPLEQLNQAWLKSHLPALKSKSQRDVVVENYIDKDVPKYQFWRE